MDIHLDKVLEMSFWWVSPKIWFLKWARIGNDLSKRSCIHDTCETGGALRANVNKVEAKHSGC